MVANKSRTLHRYAFSMFKVCFRADSRYFRRLLLLPGPSSSSGASRSGDITLKLSASSVYVKVVLVSSGGLTFVEPQCRSIRQSGSRSLSLLRMSCTSNLLGMPTIMTPGSASDDTEVHTTVAPLMLSARNSGLRTGRCSILSSKMATTCAQRFSRRASQRSSLLGSTVRFSLYNVSIRS